MTGTTVLGPKRGRRTILARLRAAQVEAGPDLREFLGTLDLWADLVPILGRHWREQEHERAGDRYRVWLVLRIEAGDAFAMQTCAVCGHVALMSAVDWKKRLGALGTVRRELTRAGEFPLGFERAVEL